MIQTMKFIYDKNDFDIIIIYFKTYIFRKYMQIQYFINFHCYYENYGLVD